jgi:hypothetical protein
MQGCGGKPPPAVNRRCALGPSPATTRSSTEVSFYKGGNPQSPARTPAPLHEPIASRVTALEPAPKRVRAALPRAVVV